MNYLEYDFKISPMDPWADILAYELGEVGFESFVETPEGMKAYIPENLNNIELIKSVDTLVNPEVETSFEVQLIEDENWNAEWEKNFDPINIDDKVYIYADFHTVPQGIDWPILITPKMSFGTGHHATTHMMVQNELNINFEGKHVLDMGCGTGVLAILAMKLGAADAVAIDIDSWAYENTLENVSLNATPNIEVREGDVDLIHDDEPFDVILANINKNIVIRQLPEYAKKMKAGGTLVTSGYFTTDIHDVQKAAEKSRFNYKSHLEKDGWASVVFEYQP